MTRNQSTSGVANELLTQIPEVWRAGHRKANESVVWCSIARAPMLHGVLVVLVGHEQVERLAVTSSHFTTKPQTLHPKPQTLERTKTLHPAAFLLVGRVRGCAGVSWLRCHKATGVKRFRLLGFQVLSR